MNEPRVGDQVRVEFEGTVTDVDRLGRSMSVHTTYAEVGGPTYSVPPSWGTKLPDPEPAWLRSNEFTVVLRSNALWQRCRFMDRWEDATGNHWASDDEMAQSWRDGHVVRLVPEVVK